MEGVYPNSRIPLLDYYCHCVVVGNLEHFCFHRCYSFCLFTALLNSFTLPCWWQRCYLYSFASASVFAFFFFHYLFHFLPYPHGPLKGRIKKKYGKEEGGKRTQSRTKRKKRKDEKEEEKIKKVGERTTEVRWKEGMKFAWSVAVKRREKLMNYMQLTYRNQCTPFILIYSACTCRTV